MADEFPIFGRKRNENDQLVAVIRRAAESSTMPIIGRRGENTGGNHGENANVFATMGQARSRAQLEAPQTGGAEIVLIGGPKHKELIEGEPKKMGFAKALWEYTMYKGLGPFADVFNSGVGKFVTGLRKAASGNGVEVVLPTAHNASVSVDKWLREIQKDLGTDIVLGKERHSLRIQAAAEQRTAQAMSASWIEFRGAPTEEEVDVAAMMFEEWVVTRSGNATELLLRKMVNARYQDIAAAQLRAGTGMSYGEALKVAGKYASIRQSPIIYYTDGRTAAWIVGKEDKRKAKELEKQTWSILPSGIMVNNPAIPELRKRLIPWELIAFAGDDPRSRTGAEIIEIIPISPEFINVLRTAGPRQFLPDFQKVFKDVGGVLTFNSLAERAGGKGDRLPSLPVRDAEKVMGEMRRMKNIWGDMFETLGIADQMVTNTEARVRRPIRPQVVRNEFKSMITETMAAQRIRAQEALKHLLAGQANIDKGKNPIPWLALDRKIQQVRQFLASSAGTTPADRK